MSKMILAPKYLWDGISDNVLEGKAVLVDGSNIVSVDGIESIKQEAPDAEILQNDNWLMMPAFVDAHDHGRGMSPISFGTPDRALEMWLQDLNKLPAIPHYEACYYDGMRLASSGVSTVLHSHNPNSFAKIREEMVNAERGYKAAGVRSILCPLYLDQNKRIYYNRDEFIAGLPEPLRTSFAAGIHDKIMSMDEYLALVEGICTDLAEDIKEGWTEVQLHPNGGQWCSDEALLQMKEYALSHGMYIHLHLLETQYQAEYAQRTWGKSFIKHYKDIGFLGPWVSFAHAVWLDDEDLQIIADTGAHLITNPSSNLRLRSGIFNMKRANELHIDCGIGLDGCAFDDDQDYLREMRVAWLNNHCNGVDGEVDYHDVLKMATSRGAKISASPLTFGTIKAGSKADFTMLDMQSVIAPYADPGIDPLALVVQRGTRSSVAMTCVNGQITWMQTPEFSAKEKDAEQKICSAIHELRAKDDGKRNNSVILQHVHDFYANTH